MSVKNKSINFHNIGQYEIGRNADEAPEDMDDLGELKARQKKRV